MSLTIKTQLDLLAYKLRAVPQRRRRCAADTCTLTRLKKRVLPLQVCENLHQFQDYRHYFEHQPSHSSFPLFQRLFKTPKNFQGTFLWYFLKMFRNHCFKTLHNRAPGSAAPAHKPSRWSFRHRKCYEVVSINVVLLNVGDAPEKMTDARKSVDDRILSQ